MGHTITDGVGAHTALLRAGDGDRLAQQDARRRRMEERPRGCRGFLRSTPLNRLGVPGGWYAGIG